MIEQICIYSNWRTKEFDNKIVFENLHLTELEGLQITRFLIFQKFIIIFVKTSKFSIFYNYSFCKFFYWCSKFNKYFLIMRTNNFAILHQWNYKLYLNLINFSLEFVPFLQQKHKNNLGHGPTMQITSPIIIIDLFLFNYDLILTSLITLKLYWLNLCLLYNL